MTVELRKPFLNHDCLSGDDEEQDISRPGTSDIQEPSVNCDFLNFEELRDFMKHCEVVQNCNYTIEGTRNSRRIIKPSEFQNHTLLCAVGYALFGLPQEEESAANEHTGYDENQLGHIKKIAQIITHQNKVFDCNRKIKNEIHFAVLFVVVIDKEKNAKQFPVFKVFVREKGDEAVFVDHNTDYYKNWEDFIAHNKYYNSLICAPKNGSYYYDIDRNKTVLEYSMAKSSESTLMSVATVIGKISAVTLSIVSFFLPVGWAGLLPFGISTAIDLFFFGKSVFLTWKEYVKTGEFKTMELVSMSFNLGVSMLSVFSFFKQFGQYGDAISNYTFFFLVEARSKLQKFGLVVRDQFRNIASYINSAVVTSNAAVNMLTQSFSQFRKSSLFRPMLQMISGTTSAFLPPRFKKLPIIFVDAILSSYSMENFICSLIKEVTSFFHNTRELEFTEEVDHAVRRKNQENSTEAFQSFSKMRTNSELNEHQKTTVVHGLKELFEVFCLNLSRETPSLRVYERARYFITQLVFMEMSKTLNDETNAVVSTAEFFQIILRSSNIVLERIKNDSVNLLKEWEAFKVQETSDIVTLESSSNYELYYYPAEKNKKEIFEFLNIDLNNKCKQQQEEWYTIRYLVDGLVEEKVCKPKSAKSYELVYSDGGTRAEVKWFDDDKNVVDNLSLLNFVGGTIKITKCICTVYEWAEESLASVELQFDDFNLLFRYKFGS